MRRSDAGMLRFVLLVPTCLALLYLSESAPAQTPPSPDPDPIHVPVVFSGGHETDPRDRGRPVILIAAALGVPPEVFRDAFTQVRPAPAGTEPDPDQVRQNKAALLGALGPYGVTDDRLNTVSNYYRYAKSRGEMWPTQEATAYAVISGGTVTSIVILTGGSGYSSPPTVSVPGYKTPAATVQLAFGKSFQENGSVSGITLAAAPN